jgi:hypothetical protein
MRRSPTRLRFPASYFVHHAGITDALDDHDRDEFAEAGILRLIDVHQCISYQTCLANER